MVLTAEDWAYIATPFDWRAAVGPEMSEEDLRRLKTAYYLAKTTTADQRGILKGTK